MPVNIPMMAGNIVGNVITQYLGMVQNESQREKNYLEALKAVKAGTIKTEDIQLRQEQPLQIPQMVGELVRQIVQGYVPLIEDENKKAIKYHGMLDAISRGQLDVQSLNISDDGVDIIPPLADEEETTPPELEPEE